MQILLVGLKVGLIAGVLIGAGLVLARSSLRPPPEFAAGRAVLLQRTTLWLMALCALASAAVLVFRLGGSFDPAIVNIVLRSPTGLATGMFLLGAITALSFPKLDVYGALLIVVATGIAGHASAQSFVSGMLVAIHVGVASWWTGGLLILGTLCPGPDSDSLTDVLQRFSRQARLAILTLVAAGGWAVYDLTGFAVSALGTAYGQILLLKLVLVAGLLCLALFNRLVLTPGIRNNRPGARNQLRKSVFAELSIIAVIAVFTGVLTTVLSPPM